MTPLPEVSAHGVMLMSHEYEVEYGEDGKAQINRVPQQSQRAMPQDQGAYYQQPPYGYPPYKEPLRLPAVVNTILSIGFAVVVFFGAQRFAPHDFRPSTMIGGFEAEVSEQLKAAEINQQAKMAKYEAEVKVAVETQAKQNEMMLQAILQHYIATYERAKTMTEAANNYQGKYLDATISQTAGVQSSDVGIVSIATLAGRGLNLLQPGSGDGALEYAEKINEGLRAGLTEAATQAVRVDLTGWNYGLPPPSEVQAMIASFRPVQIPKPPTLSVHGYSDQSKEDDRASQHGRR
jgi:hypothetical protein